MAPAAPRRPVAVRRSFDPADINPILNHPDVYRFAATKDFGPFEISHLLADERNVLLVVEGGAILFCWHDAGIYEVHTNFLKPEGGSGLAHGRNVLERSHACYRWMFTHTDCVMLLTRIPAHNRAAMRIAPSAGWIREFERNAIWPSVDAGLVAMTFYALRYDRWLRLTPDLMRAGREFHDRLSEEFSRHGHLEEQHPDEDCHDWHVGAAIEMVRGGQMAKAVLLYNRWARFAGYGLIALISESHRMIHIGNALLKFADDGSFKVVTVYG